MRRATAFMGAALVLVWASAASAQAKPDFSGTWTVDADKTAAANPDLPMGGGAGAPGGRGMMMGRGPMTVTVDAATLTREADGPNGPTKVVYKLDGSEQTISFGMGEALAKASWEGDQLTIVTTSEGRNGPMTTRAVWAREGDWLVITTTRPGRDGGEMTTKVFYRKG